MAGELVGNYEVVRRLAQGGMAEVLLAKQRGMGGFERLVCLKRILPHLRGKEDFLKMFQDEARIAANLSHPNIAQIYTIDRDQGALFIAMEYVRGEDVRRVYNQEVARGRALPWAVAAQIAMGVAAGLDYAHRQANPAGKPLELVHRDISPQNVIVSYDGHIKIIDFGVVKAADKLLETRAGVLKGKYSYMSPEQARGEPVDGRTDIFALGITLYEITCGARLFKRDSELETLQAVIGCDVAPPSSRQADYPKDLEAVVMRALAHDPDDRYATAGELEQALEALLKASGQPTSASQLAAYMQELFAEKLADEALFGGPPWSEADTGQRRGDGAVATVISGQAHDTIAQPGPGAAPADPSGPGGGWDADLPIEEQTGQLLMRGPGGAMDRKGARRPTLTLAAGPPTLQLPRGTGTDGGAPAATAAPTFRRRGNPTWAVLASLGALAMAAAGCWWWAAHRRQPAPPAAADLAKAPPPPGQPPGPQVDPHRALLTVTAPIPLAVSLGNTSLGDTPLRAMAVKPGAYRLRLEGRSTGLLLRRQVALEAGTTTHVDIGHEEGHIEVWAKPWAWVQMGVSPPRETPLSLDLLEGQYTLTFECPDGRRRVATVEVIAGGRVRTGVDCAGLARQ